MSKRSSFFLLIAFLFAFFELHCGGGTTPVSQSNSNPTSNQPAGNSAGPTNSAPSNGNSSSGTGTSSSGSDSSGARPAEFHLLVKDQELLVCRSINAPRGARQAFSGLSSPCA